MAFNRKKFLAKFVDDAKEHLKKMNEGFLHLEKNPGAIEIQNDIFRAAHTIKGSSRMMSLKPITAVAHKLEDALDALRGKKIEHSQELSDIFFQGLDIIAEMVEQTAAGGEITLDTKNLCDKLEQAAQGTLKEEAARETRTLEVSGDELAAEDCSSQKQAPKDVKQKIDETIRISTVKLDETIKLMEEIVSHQTRLKHKLYDIKEAEALSRKNMELLKLVSKKEEFSTGNGHKEEIIQTARSLHLKLKQLATDSRDDAALQEILTGELQEKALRMRMLPLSTVFDNFHRAVRDISSSLGKKIDFTVEGGETELDKKLIEKIGDPLIHMIRNSIDHGIERPADRIKAGKPDRGTIKLSACYEGGNALIMLADNGAGISIKKIKEKALQRRMFNEETLEKMSGSEIINLIFLPNFSTGAIITDVSGRGVGMDVVKKNIIDQLRGSIQIETEIGKGATFYIRLPLTLAIMRVLQIKLSGMIYAISVNSISEILKVPKAEVIDVVDKKAIRLREQIIPLANLCRLLNIPGKSPSEENVLLIIVVIMGNEKLGLIVDAIHDEEDMVIKPLPSHMKDNQWVSGVTISGKNEIINVLLIPTIFNAAKEIKEEKHIEKKEEKKAINILVVDDSVSTREIEKDILESYGYKVDLAGDGLEGFEKATKFKYDLVITDVEMPRMDGFSLTEKLRKNDEYKNTPIVIVTSREKEEDKRRGVQVGADAYIIKGSFDQSNLLDVIQNLLG